MKMFEKKMQERASRELIVVIHRLEKRGGQERSTLEIVSRLVKLNTKIHLFSFVLSDWPEDSLEEKMISWQRIPGFWIPTQLIKNIWFMAVTYILIGLKFSKNRPPILTIGTASLIADVRVIQFFQTAFLKHVRSGTLSYPNIHTKLHVLYQSIFYRFESFLERKLLPRTKKLIAISEQVEHDILNSKIIDLKKTSISVIHHSADILYSMQDSIFERGEPANILFVGALERKGIEKALNVLDLMSKKSKSLWHFHVIGGGHVEKWKDLTASLGLKEKVTFYGEQPSTPHFKKADIFLFPSIYEPFGLAVSEAVSHRLAPLVSKECGAMELWKDRESWLSLSHEDADEKWAQALQKLVESKELCHKIAAQAKNSFSSWTWDKAAENYYEAIDSLFY